MLVSLLVLHSVGMRGEGGGKGGRATWKGRRWTTLGAALDAALDGDFAVLVDFAGSMAAGLGARGTTLALAVLLS